MNTKRSWTQVTVVVVLALASLSSIAMSAPHRDRLDILAADLCGVTSVSQFDQYVAAINWAEQGGQVPFALTVSCEENSPDLSASLADLGGESGVRWEQYMAAIEGRELELDAAPVHTVTGNSARFEQYTAAIEWAERGGNLPEALTESYGEESLNSSSSFAGEGGESWARFEQYMAAIEGTEQTRAIAPAPIGVSNLKRIEQYLLAVEEAFGTRMIVPVP